MSEAAVGRDGAAARPDIAAARRVVLKVGSSSLTRRGGAIDDERIAALVKAIVGRRAAGGPVLLASSGAIGAGVAPLGPAQRAPHLAPQPLAASARQRQRIARSTA